MERLSALASTYLVEGTSTGDLCPLGLIAIPQGLQDRALQLGCGLRQQMSLLVFHLPSPTDSAEADISLTISVRRFLT